MTAEITSGQRLEVLKKLVGLTNDEIGEWFDLSGQAVQKWTKGRVPEKRIETIVEKTGVSKEWLVLGIGEPFPSSTSAHAIDEPTIVTSMDSAATHGSTPTPLHKPESNIGSPGRYRTWSSNDPLPEDEFVYLPFKKEVAFKGGDGNVEMEDYNDYKLPFARATLHRIGVPPNRAMCFSVEGDSMEPVLPSGAMIGVNFDDTRIKDGQIYAFRHDDLFRVKILYRLPGGQVKISSYNTLEYKDEFVSIEDIVIIGRVFTWSVLN